MKVKALIAGAGGVLLCLAASAAVGREDFFRSYLLGFTFWLGMALGSLAILLLHTLTGGGWGEAIRGYLEGGARTVPVMALLFVPLLFGLSELYVWTHADVVAADEALRWKSAYLNVPFFLVRAGFYFVTWTALAWLWRRRPEIGGPGLIAYGLTMTFASIDWIMSLDPHWYSTIHAITIMMGQVLGAFALATAVAALSGKVPTEPLHDLGKLLFAFVMLWGYVSFSQFLIIWSGNLPEEITWMIRRMEGGYAGLGLALVTLHFALPFLVLLPRAVKRNPRRLAFVALALVALRWVDLFWQIAPDIHGAAAAHGGGMHVLWTDIAVPIGIGGVWFAAYSLFGGSSSSSSSGGGSWKSIAT